jgi:hypothetical protein
MTDGVGRNRRIRHFECEVKPPVCCKQWCDAIWGLIRLDQSPVNDIENSTYIRAYF